MLAENKYVLNQKYIFDANGKSLVDLEDDNKTTWLGNNESKVLLAFIDRAKQVVSRDEIQEIVWTSNGFCVDESSVVQAISTVRKVLRDSAKEPEYIKTIPKHGYQFIATCKKLEYKNPVLNGSVENSDVAKRNSQEGAENHPVKLEKGNRLNNHMKTTLLLAILTLAVIAGYQYLSNKTEVLYEIGRVDNVSIYSLSEIPEQYIDSGSLDYCVRGYLSQGVEAGTIEKIVVTFNSQGDLMLNIINISPENSETKIIVAGKNELANVCEREVL